MAKHRETVRAWARAGGPLSPKSEHATVNNREWFRLGADQDYEPRGARQQLHDRFVADYRAQFPDVRQERKAIILAGPPGAGKSTVLRDVLGTDRNAWLTIDADEFKRALLTEAIKDGTYDSTILPPEVRAAEAAGEKFFPLELASLVHEESSILAIQLRDAAIRDGQNVVIDTVLSSPEKAVELGQRFAAAGYSVEVIDVEVPFELSEARIAGRWQDSYERALAGADELGGRWVPSEYARNVYAGPGGRSLPEFAAEQLADTGSTVMRFRRYNTPAEGQPRTVEVDKSRTAFGRPLIDTALAQAQATVSRSFSTTALTTAPERGDRAIPATSPTPAPDRGDRGR
ncbi:toxin component of a toxin/antitoxin system [Rathayibacter sp. AY1D1]|nr:toxin component of a toxin/antitoxin system [Rathayibacter sp. AY1A4]PPF52940.1 toxin component of a toxin/antitoxin system [Rathayibacter sp. AY1C2]PPG55681.1 toxin component of a toxin/antitoxin system [Rathayibacter sp. AY1C5]PPG57153.1 toxin component of a toxin/antitoxin system [Rathayibacter sp. AY1C7]PPH34761.1 toxin component of a toxin/antitoxin system [Rathayibacter sp. AY1E3]PPH42247.1 toxin component of a toxin/antitoxin system [Rathayibacter sp. AY1C9]PPH88268.1 toxin componen